MAEFEERPLLRQQSSGANNRGNIDVRSNVFHSMRTDRALHNKWGLAIGAFFMMPQVIAITVVMAMHFSDPDCDTPLKLWLIVHATRMVQNLIVRTAIVADRDRTCGAENFYNKSKGVVELFAFVWFILGNVWTFQSETCKAVSPTIYKTAVVIIILEYVIICLPLLLCLIMVPLLCFCLPCVVRFLNYVADKDRGAQREQIDRIPTVTFSKGLYPEDDSVCSICLSNYTDGEELRLLHGRHHFHKSCVDDWLKLNASCPTCRQGLQEDSAQDNNESEFAPGNDSLV